MHKLAYWGCVHGLKSAGMTPISAAYRFYCNRSKQRPLVPLTKTTDAALGGLDKSEQACVC